MIKPLKPKLVYSQWKLDVFNQKFEIPGGKVVERLIIDGKVKPVIVLPITQDNKIVLMEQYRYGAMRWMLEVPGGIIEDGEEVIDGIRREMESEVGYTSDNFVRVGKQLWFDPALQRISYDAYVALDCYKVNGQEKDFDEFIKSIQTVSPDELFNLIDNGKITDSKTLAIILLGRKNDYNKKQVY